jgi:hypothetical protein
VVEAAETAKATAAQTEAEATDTVEAAATAAQAKATAATARAEEGAAVPAFPLAPAPVSALEHRDSAAEKTLCDYAFRMMSEVPTLKSSPERPIELSALLVQLQAASVNTALYGKRVLKAWRILKDDARFVVTSQPASDGRDSVGVIYLAAAGGASEGHPAIAPSPAPALQRSRVEGGGGVRGGRERERGAAARGGWNANRGGLS